MKDGLTEREQAWIGDAVLELFARTWILREDGAMDGDKQARFTSNRFLACFGNPTSVEAKIGIIFQKEGLEAAWHHIDTQMLPLFRKQEARRRSLAHPRR